MRRAREHLCGLFIHFTFDGADLDRYFRAFRKPLNKPVSYPHHAVRDVDQPMIVSRADIGDAPLTVQTSQEFVNLRTGRQVQVPRDSTGDDGMPDRSRW